MSQAHNKSNNTQMMLPALFCFGLQDGASREARGRALLFFHVLQCLYRKFFSTNERENRDKSIITKPPIDSTMRKATKTKQQLKRREETELIKSENIEGPTRWPRNRKKNPHTDSKEH
jgi:hypothetical protein